MACEMLCELDADGDAGGNVAIALLTEYVGTAASRCWRLYLMLPAAAMSAHLRVNSSSRVSPSSWLPRSPSSPLQAQHTILIIMTTFIIMIIIHATALRKRRATLAPGVAGQLGTAQAAYCFGCAATSANALQVPRVWSATTRNNSHHPHSTACGLQQQMRSQLHSNAPGAAHSLDSL
jgi:hypothetical protein